jgi:hypothetical protein
VIIMASTTLPKADIRFAVTITDAPRYDSTQYRHFRACAYILAADKYSDSHAPELHSPDSYSVDAGPARALAGLQITAQADSDSMKRPGDEWYGWSVEYDRHRIQLRDAEEILPVLRKVQKRLDKLSGEYGRPATIAQFCTYAVSALTSESRPFMRRVDAEHDYEGTGYRSMDANALACHVQSDASEWRKSHGIGDQS